MVSVNTHVEHTHCEYDCANRGECASHTTWRCLQIARTHLNSLGSAQLTGSAVVRAGSQSEDDLSGRSTLESEGLESSTGGQLTRLCKGPSL